MSINTQPVTINLGPQHPSTHGVFRLRVTFDGEQVIDVEPVFGYLHRGTEKLAEERNYVQIVTLTDRLDYVAAMTNNLAYVRAVESLASIEVPDRGMYLRVISAELQRIASHLIATGFLLDELGAFHTPLIYCFRERERILELFEMLCGARITVSYMRPGGVFQDAPVDFWPRLDDFLTSMPGYLDELEALITENEVVLARTRDLGILSAQDAIDASITGPVLRATGVQWDLRKAEPHEVYDRLDFDVPIGSVGDTFDRYYVRVQEMRQSLRIVQQCVEQIEPGPVRSETPYFIRPDSVDTYVGTESPKGELGFYIVSDGGISPYRMHIRAPSFINLTTLRDLLIGWKMADLIVIFGSIDIVVGEVDR
ncbi:MAG: NADH-quinone oxidoreductase subunit D 1 [Chloroflexota bacterium]|jgi:NADH-quinone oxidoreductase subunit D|nr:NADH-quinone oxidoreductase subunit NuoD [Chloroflexota bacterium]GIS68599.1 MAG: NADH-quinone oxidoreductase subunit D 1 [Chloroflexota bacterium]|tara:strand:+ start:1120 stop:2223 length:1104 start_codon:yes stop_codon:yes gene_type:complete